MGSTPTALPPPPGVDQTTPTTPVAASPAPAQPSPAIQTGTQMMISVVTTLRAIAKAFPEAAPKVAEANNIMQEIMSSMMQHQAPGEPAAPPV